MMRMKKQILTLVAFVMICLLAQSYDSYMGVQAISQQADLAGD
ncbi:hypothetical protein F971_01361 [Acinetobacter vivianii]|uniref:Uncharacterized protein n=1 Tax=Acinetobacter vivianii TaxID=1776742 RepID=N8W8U9_9GAMM|nr:hypothetical protein [Acinetobacter vivianii]ENU93313.1 hypothetical protein F971_01361 [Acinetobacter vivianii]